MAIADVKEVQVDNESNLAMQATRAGHVIIRQYATHCDEVVVNGVDPRCIPSLLNLCIPQLLCNV
jgi:hypothetical protein